MNQEVSIQMAESPDAFYGRSGSSSDSIADVNRRLNRYLEQRAQGHPGRRIIESQVRFIPHTPEEQAAWRARQPAAGAGKRPAAFVTFDTAAAAYSGRPRQRRSLPQPKGAPATTPGDAPVAIPGEGVAGTVSPAPADQPEAGSQVRASKRRRQSPSGAPAKTRVRRPRRMIRSKRTTLDFQNLDRVIARWLGLP